MRSISHVPSSNLAGDAKRRVPLHYFKGGDYMKKRRYSSGMKAAVLAAHQCLATVLALCMTVLILLFMANVLNFGEKRNTSYHDTDYFTKQFENTAMDILDFVDLRRKFETNGLYDAEKKVDIWRYYQNQDVSGRMAQKTEPEAMTYRLGDLAEWSGSYSSQQLEIMAECYVDNGLHQKINILRDGESVFSQEKTLDSLRDLTPELRDEIINNIEYHYGGSYRISSIDENWAIVHNTEEQDVSGAEPHGQEPYSDTSALEGYIAGSKAEEDVATASMEAEGSEEELDGREQKIVQKIIAGKLYDLKGEDLEWLLEDLDMAYSSSSFACEYVTEDYLPAGGVSIWDMFLQGDCSLEYMQNAYQALAFTLDNINEEISRYRKGINTYNQQGHPSNVYYWVDRGGERDVYTNIEDSKGMDLPAFGKKLGKYVLFREKDTYLETNVKDMNEYFYNRMEPLYVGKKSVLFIGVDMNFPYEDAFLEARQEYDRMYPWIKICLWGAVMCFLLELICLIYLSVVAGKRDDSGQVYLNFFDRIPAEILFVPAAVTMVIFIFGLANVWSLYDGGNFMVPILLSCGITFFGTALLLIFYLSFIRRIRAGVLWYHSILHWFAHGIGQLFTNRKSCTKMLIWFGMHLLACLFILPMISASYEGGACVTGVFFFAVLCGVEAVLIIREGVQRNKVMEGISKISDGDLEYKIEEEELKGDNRKLAQAVNAIGEGLHHAVDESMKNERLQSDLITNVSHDIKTPLTSIINYVDLLKREDLQNERAQNYIAVLDSKSQRLKQLAEDLVEASKISSGNISLNMERINLVELIHQVDGEFAERFAQRNLQVVSNLSAESVVILADGRRIWRVLENLYGNVEKYAMEKTRVYMDLQTDGENVSFSIKNISKNPLNIEADELTERFIRGDISRSTEGSGLGLSIAQNLTTLMGGAFRIYLDGDLFKVMIEFRQE